VDASQRAPDFLAELKEAEANGAEKRFDELSSDALGLILYTSGTTGSPKGAMLTHQALAHSACAARVWTDLPDYSRELVIAPLFHITGLVSCACAGMQGGDCLILNYRFELSQLVDTIIQHKPNFLVATATLYIALLSNPNIDATTIGSLTRAYCGGSPVPPALVRSFKEKTGVSIHPAFGMTETAAGAIVCPHGVQVPVDPESGTMAVGLPMCDVDAMIVDENGLPVRAGEHGELLLRGPNLMKGYLNQPDESEAALAGGWMHTGDVAKMDEDGWFYIVDRKKDLINAAGYKVWPREVEEALYEHPAVLEAVVIGVQDEYRGETVKAIIALKSGAETNANEIMAHCRERLASYKIPRVVEIVDVIPKSPTGKLSRSLIKQTNI
jgi:long-chain acyl-CoA synthetase